MARILIVGIDSLDSILISQFQKDLPHFSKMKEQSPEIKFESVYPPDSVTAWASIYTGLNPAKHGIVYFIDPIDKVSMAAVEDTDNTAIRGRTFWDIASAAGKKVCIIAPLLGYPVWEVNGTMVGRSKERYVKCLRLQTFPASFSEKYDFSPLEEIKLLPSRWNFPKYIQSWKKKVREETDLGLKIWAEQEWDLFFIYSSAMDDISHNLWSHCDENDPSYPGDNPYKDVIRDFYILYDEVLGQYLSAASPDTILLVLSDHGHGMRPVKMVNINELLRQKGFLVPKIKSSSYRDSYFLLEKLKRKVAGWVNRYAQYGIGELTMRLMHAFTAVRKLYTRPPSIDWDKTTAYISDLSGIKAYTYGGVRIRRENLPDGEGEYEELRSLIIKELSEIREPSTGDNIMRWICRREKLYSGEYIGEYPDIVFELRDDYGAGWGINDSLFGTCHTHNIQPGSHKIHSPVLLLYGAKGWQPLRKEVNLMDIAPTVLSLLDVGQELGDGANFLRKG